MARTAGCDRRPDRSTTGRSGSTWLVVDQLAPFDDETIERLATEVRPLLGA